MITEGQENRQVIPILESLPSDYQPKTKDGGTPEVVAIISNVFYIPSGLNSTDSDQLKRKTEKSTFFRGNPA